MQSETPGHKTKMVTKKIIRPIAKKRPINKWAVFKVIGIIGLLAFGFYFHFPAYNTMKEWIHEEYYYTHNSVNWTYPENRSIESIQMWQHMSQKQHIVFYLVLAPYIVFIFLWFVIITRYRFKKLYVNGHAEGRAIWYYGIYRNNRPYPGGHLYDLYCIAGGFRHRCWDDFPLPSGGDFYRGKHIIYFEPSLLMNPLHCFKTAVTDNSQISWSLFSISITGRYSYNKKHPNDAFMDYLEWNNESPDRSQEPNIEIYNEYTDETTLRSQKIVTQAILGNPAIIEDVVRSSDTSMPLQDKVDFFEMLPEDKKVEIIAKLKQA